MVVYNKVSHSFANCQIFRNDGYENGKDNKIPDGLHFESGVHLKDNLLLDILQIFSILLFESLTKNATYGEHFLTYLWKCHVYKTLLLKKNLTFYQ